MIVVHHTNFQMINFLIITTEHLIWIGLLWKMMNFDSVFCEATVSATCSIFKVFRDKEHISSFMSTDDTQK